MALNKVLGLYSQTFRKFLLELALFSKCSLMSLLRSMLSLMWVLLCAADLVFDAPHAVFIIIATGEDFQDLVTPGQDQLLLDHSPVPSLSSASTAGGWLG